MKKILVGSLLTLAMLAGISFGSTLVDQNQAVTNHNDVVQLASDLPFEH
ncbi:quorum-sensing peptide PapR [Bacillus cytotoxicus]|uniref:Quorum-sensing peptide PapR n=1 Tax=Bacillus cytotoxicus TaxID=580165 RepID=A0ACC6A662_9BACI|nr:quorum-sensing peptide PapR [Bacillus cytotoxicus]